MSSAAKSASLLTRKGLGFLQLREVKVRQKVRYSAEKGCMFSVMRFGPHSVPFTAKGASRRNARPFRLTRPSAEMVSMCGSSGAEESSFAGETIVWLEPKAKTSLMIRWMVKMISYAIKLFSVKGKFCREIGRASCRERV